MTAEEKSERLLEIEENLIADKDHQYRDEVLQLLVDEARQTKARLDKGLAPAEAEKSKRMLEALYASHQVVRAVWRYHHVNSGTVPQR